MSYIPLVLISMVSLGVYYFLVKLLSVHVSSLMFIFIGNMILVPVIYTYLFFTQTSILPKRKIDTVYSLIIAIPMVIALLAYYSAIARGPVSVVAPIYGLSTMVAALLGIFILREKVSVTRVFGLVLAVTAIVLLSC
ncbi:EamA family transporter [Chloroflexota bacterium]